MRLPAEWHSPEAIWIAWPHNQETWPGRFGDIPKFFAKWIRVIAEDAPVRILAEDDVAASAKSALGSLPGNVELVPIRTNDCWIRDYGPSFVFNVSTKQMQAVNWRYNAWGEKYPPWDDDDAAAQLIAKKLEVVCVQSELCIEGGAVETDGQQRMLAFRDCIETENRNPGWTQEAIVNELYRCLGVEEIVWLDGGGLEGDDTDGHIDQLARFVDPKTVVVSVCDDHRDANAAGLIANKRQLKLWSKQTQPNVVVHELPIPPARYIDGKRVPESYCNFLRLGTDRMLVPTFGHAYSDDRALGILADVCPKTNVIGIDCRDLVWGLGALHCASLNQPSSLQSP
jgi:agmatine deiminase